MAVVQVAETLELRETLARKLLIDMLWRQLVLMGVIAAVTVIVVQRATRPVRALGARAARGRPGRLSVSPREWSPGGPPPRARPSAGA